jgi:hypothetical protein
MDAKLAKASIGSHFAKRTKGQARRRAAINAQAQRDVHQCAWQVSQASSRKTKDLTTDKKPPTQSNGRFFDDANDASTVSDEKTRACL